MPLFGGTPQEVGSQGDLLGENNWLLCHGVGKLKTHRNDMANILHTNRVSKCVVFKYYIYLGAKSIKHTHTYTEFSRWES